MEEGPTVFQTKVGVIFRLWSEKGSWRRILS